MGKINYSTNWMGPTGMWWYKENGFTRRVTRVLDHDSQFSDAKAGDTVEYDEITEHWYGGRIDIYGLPEDEYYCGQSEMSLPIMDGPSYAVFSRWLETFETDRVWTLEQLSQEFERTHPPIRWFDQIKQSGDKPLDK